MKSLNGDKARERIEERFKIGSRANTYHDALSFIYGYQTCLDELFEQGILKKGQYHWLVNLSSGIGWREIGKRRRESAQAS